MLYPAREAEKRLAPVSAYRLQAEDGVKYKVEFRYKPQDRARPFDEVQELELVFEHGEALPLPNVGDSVSYLEDDMMVARKVVTRHFSYVKGWCAVNIVVTDIPDDEMAARIKE
jgi:hypothetical protein